MRGDAAWRACGHAPGHPAMPNACLPASLGENNLLFQKTLIFWEITQNLWARHAAKAKARSPPRHAAKAKARSQGHGGMLPRPRQPPWHAPCSTQPRHAAPQGMLPRPWHASKAMAYSPSRHAARSQGHAAAKAKAAAPHGGHGTQPRPRHAAPQGMQPPKACCQGQGTQPRPWHAAKAMQQRRARQQPPMARGQGDGMLPRPRHAAKAMACCQGQGTRPRRWHAAKAMACCQAQGTQPRPWHAAKAKACCQGQGMQPRPRHAAKAKARHAAKAMACSQGQGMLSRPRHAAKAKAAPPWACCQGKGTQRRPRPRQPVKGKGHAAKALGLLASGGHGAKS